MNKLKIILQIKTKAKDIINEMTIGSSRPWVEGNKAYQNLVDMFYAVNGDFMAPEQYEATKVDAGYFLRLVERAVAYWDKGNKGNL